MTLQQAASIEDLRSLARRQLPRMVFDYIDGAAGDEATARRNRDALDRCTLKPDVLVDISSRSLKTNLFGQVASMPIVIGPTGLNGAFWEDGDLALARAAAAEGVPFVLSTAATVDLKSVLGAAGPLRWFQLYMMRDRGLVAAFLRRVRASGFGVLQLTVDTTVAGRRNRDIRNGFTLPFRWTVRNFVDCALHPGISSSEQVRRAITAGVDGVVVSNHGGRQLDGSRATVEWLPEIVDAAAGRLSVLVDSGFRTGTDVAKAIALGADAVQLGRATLYGLAAAGELGARHALQILRQELDRAMALCGAPELGALRGRVDTVPTLRPWPDRSAAASSTPAFSTL